MISLEDARVLLLDGVGPLGVEREALESCDDRILAEDLIASIDQPAEPRSAMDGYAVRAQDAAVGCTFTVVGEAYAGAPFCGDLEPNAAVRIGTGGVIPTGADRVLMQEACRREEGLLTLVGPLSEASFIRPAAGDFARGEVLLRAGLGLGAAQLALAAAAGSANLPVRRRPRIAIFASGDELREPGEAIHAGQTYNSASIALKSLVQGWGGTALRQATLPDDLTAAMEAIGAARSDADVLLFIGGASVGDRDVLRDAVKQLGGVLRFDRIAVQPGKPSWHSRLPDGQLVLGLPGNPASAFVCAHLLLEPLIATLLRRPSRTSLFPAKLTGALPGGSGRECYWRARASIDDDGQLTVAPDRRSDSSLQRALADSNALIRREAQAIPIVARETVSVLLTGPLRP